MSDDYSSSSSHSSLITHHSSVHSLLAPRYSSLLPTAYCLRPTTMKVLLCFHALVTRSNHRLAEELSQDPGVELHVLAPPWWPEEARVVRQEKLRDPAYTIRQAPLLYWGRPRPNLFAYRAGLGRALREVQPDILDFYEEPFSLVMGQALALRARHAPRAR